jgi:hypothetical protein
MIFRIKLFKAIPAALAVVGSGFMGIAHAHTDITSDAYPMASDLRHQDKNIHWPDGFSPDGADLFAHNETIVHAPCDVVWNHIADATDWSKWYNNASNVHYKNGETELTASSVFQWRTFGVNLESKMVEFEPARRMGWFGYSPGKPANFYHTWYLVPIAKDCRVVTEEVGRGEDARRFRQADESMLHRGHDLWLAGLKWVSETPAQITNVP